MPCRLPRPPAVPTTGVLVLLACFAALALAGSRHDSVTVDEFSVVPSGLAKLRFPGEVDWLNPNNPPLGQLAVALPLLGTGARLPREWVRAEAPELRWAVGERFMQANRAEYVALFERARAASVLLGLALCLVVFAWSCQAFGAAGGLVSLALCATCPNLLAHGHLATVDMAFTVACVASFWLLWRLVAAPRPRLLREWLPWSLAVAAALNTKYTFLLLLPLHLAAAAAAVLRPGPGRAGRAGALAASAALALVITGALQRFDGVGTPVGRLPFESRALQAVAASPLGALPSPVPAWYLRGLDAEAARLEQRRNQYFLRGEVYDGARPGYFATALLVKTPLPHLALLALALAVLPGAWRRAGGTPGARLRLAALLVPAAWYLLAFSLGVGANQGIRYVLPVLPLAYALAGLLGERLAPAPGARTPAAWRGAVAALLVAAAAAAAWSAPRFLSSFNLVAGGARGGSRWLSDSNVDWGQDLRDLRRAMDALGLRTVALSYFGTVDPRLYGIEATRPEAAGPGDVLAISVHHLNGIAPFDPPPPGLVDWLRGRASFAWAGDSILLFRLPE